mmetsp:Transcript_23694/g.70058  ORF Transcript_23694/g.70058 Transcript_23694/m.70058 type:complete len:338 (-) Transcript_23694:111-1124(-)
MQQVASLALPRLRRRVDGQLANVLVAMLLQHHHGRLPDLRVQDRVVREGEIERLRLERLDVRKAAVCSLHHGLPPANQSVHPLAQLRRLLDQRAEDRERLSRGHLPGRLFVVRRAARDDDPLDEHGREERVDSVFLRRRHNLHGRAHRLGDPLGEQRDGRLAVDHPRVGAVALSPGAPARRLAVAALARPLLVLLAAAWLRDQPLKRRRHPVGERAWLRDARGRAAATAAAISATRLAVAAAANCALSSGGRRAIASHLPQRCLVERRERDGGVEGGLLRDGDGARERVHRRGEVHPSGLTVWLPQLQPAARQLRLRNRSPHLVLLALCPGLGGAAR